MRSGFCPRRFPPRKAAISVAERRRVHPISGCGPYVSVGLCGRGVSREGEWIVKLSNGHGRKSGKITGKSVARTGGEKLAAAVKACMEGLEERQMLSVNPAAVKGDGFSYSHGLVTTTGGQLLLAGYSG